MNLDNAIVAADAAINERKAIADFLAYASENDMLVEDVINMVMDGGYIDFMRQHELKPLKEKKCEYACGYKYPYGFVPEAGCPVHDRDE